MRKYVWLICCFAAFTAHAQYAPQAGLSGSTAIVDSSAQFVAWATSCKVLRGYQDIANPAGGYATLGDSSMALGVPDLGVVSLGDSGIAVLTFAHPITDRPGPDFAVFENGFLNPANDSQAFLELAFVEVSSDGVNYVRFPATSLTQTNVQVANGDYINCVGLNNLAGKYVGHYGTPFDLEELAGSQGLDINNVTHVRIVDVVGSIGAHAQRDHTGNVINDPYPTPFASCGFDLDAVGVIHQGGSGVTMRSKDMSLSIYPNPADDKVLIAFRGVLPQGVRVELMNITGETLQQKSLTQQANTIEMQGYAAGMYYLVFYDANGAKWAEKVMKR